MLRIFSSTTRNEPHGVDQRPRLLDQVSIVWVASLTALGQEADVMQG